MGQRTLFRPAVSRARVRDVMAGAACGAVFGVGAVMAAPLDMTLDRLLDICASPTVEAASAKGDALGWTRLTGAQVDEWRRHFLSYNGGSVDSVSWQRTAGDAANSLSFWIALGPNAHRACTYATSSEPGLLDAMLVRLGKPDALDRIDAATSVSAFWKRGAIQHAFSRVGSRSLITISRN